MKYSFSTKEKVIQDMFEWYLYCSSSDCFELSSNFSIVINAAFSLGGNKHNGVSFDIPYTEANFAAIERKRNIEKKIKKLSKKHYDILFASFAKFSKPAKDLSAYHLKYFGRYSGAALYSKLISKKQLTTLLSKFYTQKPTEEDKQLLLDIRKESALSYETAILSFWEIK